MIPALALAWTCFAQQAYQAYVAADSAQLRALLAVAPTREDTLVVRYRLYPLTRDPRLLESLPSPGSRSGARELAMLSALWAWRIPGSAPWNVVRYGRRAGSLLDRALEADSADALVRLVEAQSLLFRPAVAGGSVTNAVARLARLRAELPEGACGTDAWEVDYWRWFALRRANDTAAVALAARLARAAPALFQQMLNAPR